MKEAVVFICEVCLHFEENKELLLHHEKLCIEQRDVEIQQRKDRETTGQLTIAQIIKKCEILPDLSVVIYNVEDNNHRYHGMFPYNTNSYRGNYNELAIEVSHTCMTLSNFLKKMKDSLHRTYSGYKGGDFYMYEDTFVWVAEYGLSSNMAVVDVVLAEDKQLIKLIIKKIS